MAGLDRGDKEIMELTIPGGNEKGATLSAASASTLEYWIKRISTAIETGDSRNEGRDKRLVDAMTSELRARGNGERAVAAQAVGTAPRPNMPGGSAPAAQPPPARAALQADPQTALALRAQVEELSGSYDEPTTVMNIMRRAAQVAHLVAPSPTCGALPAGCAIVANVIWIDAQRETYGIPSESSSNRGLDKTALSKIANAAGIDWDPELCRRLDDSSDMHYVHYRAVGRVRNFDGTMRTEVGSVEMDLREGSETYEETWSRAKRGKKETNDELGMMRKFILRHAESKAMNRVVRRLGIRSKYTLEELQRPFIVMRLMFTGQTDDPELKRMFAAKIAETFLGAAATLYRTPAPALGSAHQPPPVGLGSDDDDAPEHTDDEYSEYDEDPRSLGDGERVDPLRQHQHQQHAAALKT
jgi:hypothetical protein